MTTTFIFNTFQRLGHRKSKNSKAIVDHNVFGQKLGLMTRLFGCWHEDVGRPFVKGKTAYRACLSCGARRQFDPETFETFGNFYSNPVVRQT